MIRSRLLLFLIAIFCSGLFLSLAAAPITAQGDPVLVTNTPQQDVATPAAPFERYALRFWLETDLLALLSAQLEQLVANVPRAANAVSLTLYELQRRFPGAPHDVALREQLLALMVQSPRGSVDMRSIVRPYVEILLNQQQPDLSEGATLQGAGFTVEVSPADLNGDARPDAVLHTSYRSGVDLLYNDYVLATRDAAGLYQIYESNIPYPAAPLSTIQSVTLERIDDATGDSADELVLFVGSTGVVNTNELMIFGVRGDRAVSLIETGQRIQFGELLSWVDGTQTLTVVDYQLESEAWGCISEAPAEWTFSSSYFRPVTATVPTHLMQDSLACRMFDAEPLFALTPAEAIITVRNILAGFTSLEPGAIRAGMVLAMLHELNGERDVALEQVRLLEPLAEDDAWLSAQIAAFINAAENPQNTPLYVCAAVEEASIYPACDIDGVLTRMFAEEPLRRDVPLVEQLEERGLFVLETLTITPVGGAPRTLVQFNIPGANWWAFAPTSREFYSVEMLDVPPTGYELTVVPPTQIMPPQAVYDALLLRDDIPGALVVLENAQSAYPAVPLTPEGFYIQALSYDLLGDRENARGAYFQLWRVYPNTLWGQLAAAHLELR